MLDDGAVFISGGKIRRIGRWREMRGTGSGSSCDLGEVVLLPGLVNAHCHLDLTGAGDAVEPADDFTGWIHRVIAARSSQTGESVSRAWQRGASMLLETGTTTVANIESPTTFHPGNSRATPLRVHAFMELTGVLGGRPPGELIDEALQLLSGLPDSDPVPGLSPHAPYSTLPELLRQTAGRARARNLPLTIHVAESAEEWEMFMNQRGSLHDWLRAFRDPSDCDGRTPVRHLEFCGLLHENLLAVHANYLNDEDVRRLAENRVSVVHCPGSHRFFGHQPFAYDRLRRAGVNVCLGTDSLASTCPGRSGRKTLSLPEEMNWFSRAHPEVNPMEILEMATRNGARALREAGSRGALIPGARADLIAVAFGGMPEQIADFLVHDWRGESETLVGGQWLAKSSVPAPLS